MKKKLLTKIIAALMILFMVGSTVGTLLFYLIAA